MKYPKQLKVGDRTYTVTLVDTIKRCCGYVEYPTAEIAIGQRNSYTGRSYKQETMDDTFWHELTHAILYEMGSKMYRNEKFVSEFATMLTKAIKSARF